MAYLQKKIRTKHITFVVKVKCFYYNPAASKKKRGVRLKSTGEGKKKRNAIESYRKKKYLIYNNFDLGDIWATLTYKEDKLPESPDAAHKELMNVLSKLRKKLARKGIPLVYYIKTEAGEGMRVHHHLFIKNTFPVISMLYDYWKEFGNIKDFREIYNLVNGKLVKYFLDGGEHKGLSFEKYSHSRNMAEPEVERRIYPAESFKENPKPPKEYIIQNLFNAYPDIEGYIYQEYELINKKYIKEREGDAVKDAEIL